MSSQELFRVARLLDSQTVEQINDLSHALLNGSGQSADHLSEYVSPRGFLGPIPATLAQRYVEAVVSGAYSPEHGYDEDPVSLKVSETLRQQTASHEVAIVSSGTAANLCLIAAFVDNDPGCRFVACRDEHTVNTEGSMLQRAGIRKENMVLVGSKYHSGFIEVEDLTEAIKDLPSGFIFQLAIPSNQGVVPSIEYLRQIIGIVKNAGGKFLVDGARLANALVFWDKGLDFLSELGVDGFTLGTSKKGGIAEVVCVQDESAGSCLKGVAKSFGQISSKGGLLAFVTGGILGTGYWRQEARAENLAASRCAQALDKKGAASVWPVCSNMVFIKLSPEQRRLLEQRIGLTYDDYGPDNDITRITFAGFIPDEEINATVKAIAACALPPST